MAVGVATSLSCTDSSTGSSEDASEPGSPYSPHSNIGDDQQQQILAAPSSNNSKHCNKSKMPPQTILAANSSNSNSNSNGANSATNVTNSHSTVTGTNTTNSNSNNVSNNNNNTNNNNNNNALNTAKIKSQTTQSKVCNTAMPRNTLPSLQWNRNTAVATPIGCTAGATLKKRSAINTSTDSAAKKSRSTGATQASLHDATTALSNSAAVSSATASKRLKAAALEESQTKITGYFKSQMKAQIHQTNNGKKPELIVPTTTSSSANGLTTNTLTMAPATTASLNKYFNILSQLKDNSSNREQSKTALVPSSTSTASTNSVAVAAAAPTPIGVSTAMPPTTMPIPALKKIERSKPTKIAQVAPNMRKTPTNNNYSTSTNGKSPTKKHVAIAPRTPEMKQQQQQQQQQQAVSGKGQDCNKHVLPQQATPAQVQGANQSAVLLTAIRLPPQQQQQQQSQQPQLKPVTPAKLNVPTTTTATAANSNATLFQLPVQLPNLVQLPQLLAANTPNIMQLNNVATAAAKTAATTTAATSAQAAQAAAAQYFLNGTVFKLQQFTTATTTTATSAVAATSTAPNPFNLMSANDLQDLLLKQQQQQLQFQQQQQKAAAATTNSFQEIFHQQIAAAFAANQQQQFQQLQRLGAAANMQQQPVFMATPAGLLLNAASLPAMLAQAAAALAVNNNQQQQQKSLAIQQHQQLPALQPIQHPLPALSSIFAPNGQQQQHAQTQHEDLQQQQQQQQYQQQQQQLAHQLALAQQQFITATQPPPLSAVTISNSNNNTANNNNNISNISNCSTTIPTATPQTTQTATAKLAIVKATSTTQFPALSSQPPPLVTISNAKARTHATGSSSNQSKPSALAKPYQKRAPKLAAQPKAIAAANSSKTKIRANGKIIATPTTPPPLVPALIGVVKELSSIRPTAATKPNISIAMPTPALVSIANAKVTQSIAPTVVTNTSSSSSSSSNAVKSMQLPQLIAAKPIVATAAATPCATVTPSTVQTGISTPDPFDLLKNSLNTSNLMSSTVCSNSNSNSNSNCSSLATALSAVGISKIKEEPLEDTQTATECTMGAETLTSFSGQISSADIKVELMEDNTKMSVSQSSNMHHECSSSSFSSNSNFVSSAADLSLEASTPPSSTASSRCCSSTPSPAPSLLATVSSPRHSPTLCVPQTCVATLNAVDTNSNSSNSLTNSATCSHASSQDMLSEMVTSTCISSAASSVSNMTITTHNNDDKEMDENKCNADMNKRDLPTPESGIGGSLSNSESSISVVSEMISNNNNKRNDCSLDDVAPTIADTTCTDSISPPPTPLTTNNSSNLSSSDNSIASNAPSPASTPTDVGDCSNASAATSPSATTPSTPTTIDTQLAEESSEVLPKSAISPILSQPKTIRFPAESGHRYGPKGAKRNDGVCYWDKCNKKHDSNSKLLDHMQTQHVNSQTGPFACLWVGCKVYNKESCSRRWLERHVLSHGGSKQFKCIVEGCGLRFGSQLALQKHVNNHFTATENKESTNKRTSDPPVPKQLRKNGKKLRYRRQPFSARMFDFFDSGIMEGLQHRLRQISSLTGGRNSLTFQGHCVMRRTTFKGDVECFVRWHPREIIDDEWVPESKEPYMKIVNIKNMKMSQKIKVDSLLTAAYKLPYMPNLLEHGFAFQQHTMYCGENVDDNGENNNAAENVADTDEDEAADGEDDDEDDEDDDDDDDDDDESNDTTSSYAQVLTIAKMQMQQRQKHPRKPQKRNRDC